VIAGSTLPLRTRRDESPDPGIWEADLRSLVRLGFRHIDLVDSWLAPGDLGRASLSELAAVITSAGGMLAGMSAIRRSVIDPEEGKANLAYTHRTIDAAAALHAPVLSIGFHRPLTALQREWAFWIVPAPTDRPDSHALAVSRLRELARHAASVGVRLSLELYEGTLLSTGAQAARLVEDVGSDSLGINADLANLYRVPERLAEGWLETLRLCLPYMNYWHVKNYRRVEHYPDGPFLTWPAALDDGDIDYRLALRMAAESGYGGPVCVEHYGGDGLSAEQRGLAYLSTLLEDM
jgi:sugar phosphate isomerase/epimerase